MSKNNHEKHWATRKARQRLYFQVILSAYHELRSVLFSPGALDYSNSDMSSPIYGEPTKGFTGANFILDVQLTAKRCLGAVEFESFERTCLQKLPDFKIQSVDFMRLQEKLGRYWFGSGMYPLSRYFNDRRLHNDM